MFDFPDPPVSECRHLVMSDPGGVGRHSEDITRPPACGPAPRAEAESDDGSRPADRTGLGPMVICLNPVLNGGVARVNLRRQGRHPRHRQPRRNEAARQAKGITLAVRPPKGAKMNGGVDRMPATGRHASDTVQDTATPITERNPRIDTHRDLDNGWRLHDARDDQTPNEDRESRRIAANP